MPSSPCSKVCVREDVAWWEDKGDVWEEPANPPCPHHGLVSVWQKELAILGLMKVSSGQVWSLDLAWIVCAEGSCEPSVFVLSC